MPMEVIIYDGAEKIKHIEVPGELEDCEVLIRSTEEVEFPATKTSGEPPEVPDVPMEAIEKQNNRTGYRRMVENPDSQAAQLRRFIYEQQYLTRKQIDEWATEKGYSPHGGGIQTVLIVLENVTEEVKRVGQENDSQRIIWVGED